MADDKRLPREDRLKVQAWALVIFIPPTITALIANSDSGESSLARSIVGGAFWWTVGAEAIVLLSFLLPQIRKVDRRRLVAKELANILALLAGLAAVFHFV
jgi:uncharacterized membrane protein YhaH (DUF805 family)